MEKQSYNKRQVGTEKEILAAEYLKKKGYFIIEKNYRVRQGEIDLVARDGAALYYLNQKKISIDNTPIRFDVIGINGDTITHIENAFDFVMTR